METKIIQLEERLRLAMLNSDVATLDELISPNLLFTNHLGVLVSKEDDLSAHASKAFVFKSLNLSESKYSFMKILRSCQLEPKSKVTITASQPMGVSALPVFGQTLRVNGRLLRGIQVSSHRLHNPTNVTHN